MQQNHLNDLALLNIMATAREGDRREGILFRQGRGRFQLPGSGHEALAAIARAMGEDDVIFPHYRDRALMLARGMSTLDIARAYLGKKTATGGGRQLPSHFDDRRLNVFSCASPTGLQCLPAAGMAWAHQRQGRGSVTLCCLGDATARQGEFYEALSFAIQEKLPLVFLIEDNGYGISTPTAKLNPYRIGVFNPDFSVIIDGRSIRQVEQAAASAFGKAREGGGPTVIIAELDRLSSHTSSDDHRRYRSETEIAAMQTRDPLLQLKNQLVDDGFLNEQDWLDMTARIEEEVDRDYRKAADEADPTETEAATHLYASAPLTPCPVALADTANVTLIGAVTLMLDDLLKTKPNLMLFGEDIEDGKGGVFGMTKGLSSAYPGRVVNSPLAEATVMGVGAGLAIAGMRPIVELQFIDFVGPAFNQLVNQVATLRWRSMGAWTCPLTIIAPCGAYLPSGGPWHSQSNESWFLHMPGLRVAMPSTASDAAGFLRAAIAGDDPVLLLIPKHLFRARFDLAATDTVCFGKAAIRREGDDVTIVTWGNGTEICLEAAQSAAAKGINARIIDLRSLSPYDAEAIERSVVQTGNLIVVNEDAETCNFGDTIVARLCANPSVFSRFKTRPIVISSSTVPIGFNPALEAAVIPRVETVIHAIDEVCHVQHRAHNLRTRAAIG